MKLIIEIDCDNAAFEVRDGEVSRILADLSTKVSGISDLRFLHGYRLTDSNGNTVGKVRVQA